MGQPDITHTAESMDGAVTDGTSRRAAWWKLSWLGSVRKWHLGAAAVVVAVAIYFAWTRYTASPSYSLRQIRSAVKEKDRLKFEYYIDLDGFVDKAIEEIVARSAAEAMRESDSGFGAIGAALGAGLAEKLKPALKSEFRSTVLRAVESGQMDSIFTARRDSASREMTSSMIARNITADETRFEGLTEIRRLEDVAIVGFKLRNEILDTTLVLNVRMERAGKCWRIVAPDNLGEYLNEISELQTARLAEEYQKMRDRINGMVRLGRVRREYFPFYSISDLLVLGVTLDNIGSETIKIVRIDIYTPSGPVDRPDGTLVYQGNLIPGTQGKACKALFYNAYIDRHLELRYLPLDLRVRGVITSHDTLSEYADWGEYVSRTFQEM